MIKQPFPSSLALLFILASCGPDTPLPDLAIQNVTVIDAVNGVRESRTVVIDGGRITAVTAPGESVDAVEAVDAAIETVAQEFSFTVVFDVTASSSSGTGLIVYIDPSVDITETVLAELQTQ